MSDEIDPAPSVVRGVYLDSSKAGPRPSLTNAVRVLQRDPLTDGQHLWYDLFLDRVMCRSNGIAREWRDEDDYKLTVYLQDFYGLSTMQDGTVHKAVQFVAHQRERHVIRDWLKSLTWDGESRISMAFEDHWGVECGEDLPCDYVRAASANFFVGLIARVFKPGCQLDTMVVFEGQQGIRKTSALRLLGGEWYGQANESVQHKDFLASLSGKWIVEIGELDAFSRAEVTRVKTVISTPVDRYRPSYGRVAADYPRQCVFVGTTNKDDWGNDETGLRRFWPIRCGVIHVETLGSARSQLFAEALFRYDNDVHWWEMPGVSTVGVQATRQGDHAWESLILTDLADAYECTTLDLLTRVLHFAPRDINRIHELTVGSILRRAGWVKKPARRNGRLAKVWFSPEQP